MFWRIVLFMVFAMCETRLFAQSEQEAAVELLGKELAQQATARSVSRVAIFDFTEGGEATDFSRAMSEELRIHMAIRNASLTIVDRATTEKVIEEQRLSSQPLFNESQAASLGKLVSADAIITGVITPQQREWRITAKMVSVETGAIIGGYSTTMKNTGFGYADNAQASEQPKEAKTPKHLSFHAEANAGVLFVNETAAPSIGFTFSRLTYSGDLNDSRFTKGKRGFTLGLNYHVGLPVDPVHPYTLGFRTVDGYFNEVNLNGVGIWQDSYFLLEPNADVLVTIPSTLGQTSAFYLYRCDEIQVNRLRVDLSWRHTLFESSVRVYAETGLAWVKQIDQSSYSSASVSVQDSSILKYSFDRYDKPVELPNLLELKLAVGAERGRWGLHLGGAVTTRNRDYMSPLDMFHHPNMTSWPNVQADLTNKGIAEITSQSASHNWFYWFSSILQLRYQL
jgi:TolB-like protein